MRRQRHDATSSTIQLSSRQSRGWSPTDRHAPANVAAAAEAAGEGAAGRTTMSPSPPPVLFTSPSSSLLSAHLPQHQRRTLSRGQQPHQHHQLRSACPVPFFCFLLPSREGSTSHHHHRYQQPASSSHGEADHPLFPTPSSSRRHHQPQASSLSLKLAVPKATSQTPTPGPSARILSHACQCRSPACSASSHPSLHRSRHRSRPTRQPVGP